jgi:pyruvate/2-oxoacid:ferredoxin oxidoreductase beta subunit
MNSEPNSTLNPDTLPLPFCPGCGHGTILENLDQALIKLELKPEEAVIVTDIGCAGLSDKYFSTHAFHGLHGRSATYATGIKLARPELKVIVLVGDGGFGIGGHHFLNAARRNIGIKVLVFNNFNYGMTGGEHSVTTPPGALTSSTPKGNLEQPLDIVSSVGVNGANLAARTTVFEPDLSSMIARVLDYPGFCLVDIWEICTAYYGPQNRFNKTSLEETLQELNFGTGVLFKKDRQEFSRRYRESLVGEKDRREILQIQDLEPCCQSSLSEKKEVVIAGAAGAKIATAGSLFSQGAIYAGLQAAQRGNYPVTVKTGHSIAEVTLSPEEILSVEVEKPAVLIALFPEGFEKVQHLIARMDDQDLLILHEDLPEISTEAETWRLNYGKTGRWRRKDRYRALMAVGKYLQESSLYPLEALEEAVRLKPAYAEENLAALQASQKIEVLRR